MATTLVPVPLSGFWIDENTGQIWAPDPTGTAVTPSGVRVAPVNPISTDPDGTATYAPITQDQVRAATVSPPPTTAGPVPTPAPSTPPSSALAQLQHRYGGVPLWGWVAGGALLFAMTQKRKH